VLLVTGYNLSLCTSFWLVYGDVRGPRAGVWRRPHISLLWPYLIQSHRIYTDRKACATELHWPYDTDSDCSDCSYSLRPRRHHQSIYFATF